MTRAVALLALALALALAACGSPEPDAELSTRTPAGTSAPRGTATAFPTWTAEPVTPTATATPTSTPTPIVYAIQQGDTLLDVANRFGVSASDIQEVNGITDPRTLQIGQELIIPASPGEEAPGTPTPTPMPVHVASQANVRTTAGDAVVLGEVVNDSPQGVEEVTVQVELLDAEGRPLTTTVTMAMADVVPAGGSVPFAVVVAQAPTYSQVSARVIRALPEVPARLTHHGLYLAEASGRAVYDRTFVVMGKVRNMGQDEALDAFVVVTLYAEDGTVIGAARQALDSPIPSGNRAVFEISMVPIRWPVERYEIAVEGRRPAPTPIVPSLESTPES